MDDRKESVAVILAVVVMLSGIALSFFSFWRDGKIDNSILFYVGQCMFYSGAILSGRWYLLYKIKSYVFNEELFNKRVDKNKNGVGECSE